jgi:signal transduction histidine kinase
VIFGLSLLAGRSAAAPIERSRRRQLEFAADASHELRTPLSVIRAEASLALSKPRTAEEYTRSIRRIAGESEKLNRLVDNLLFLARADAEQVDLSGPPQPLGGIAAATVERFRAVAGARSQRVEVSGEDIVGGVEAPEGWVERLASILVDNACRYTPEGGSVSVSVVSAPGHVELAVEDSGPGIPESERDRIFDRFHRASDGVDGSGLGLAIANAIVRRTRGRWSVGTSALGGAAMRVTWPV